MSVDHPLSDSPLSRTNRLDRLPFTRQHRRLLIGSGTGWALDAMDVGLISFILAQLTIQWQLTPAESSWIASIGFVGMALGASLGGLLADKIGRRQVFALTLLLYGVFTGVSALSLSVAALIIFRFLVGLGLGAELPVASTLVSEFAPPRIRGRVVVLLEAFWAVGWTLAALIGYFVVPLGDNGWRWALVIGVVPALFAVVVRFGLPESVRFLESRNRHDEAEAVVQQFEASAGDHRMPLPEADPVEADDVPHIGVDTFGGKIKALWAPTLRRRTGAIWLVWFMVNFSYYGAFIWLPSLLYASGLTLVKSFEYTLIITLAQLPGYALAAFLVERWGRRRTLAVFLVGSAASAGFFAVADGTASVLTAGMLLSFFNLGAWGALYAVTPELYPTRLRGTGAGWAAAVGRIASIIAPLCVPLLRSAGGIGLLFTVFAVVFLIAAVGSLALPELRGKALSET